MLTVADWETATLAKVRTWKKTLARMVDIFKEDIDACGLKRVVVHYIGSAAPAIKWAREAIEPVVGHAVEVLPVSPVIGVRASRARQADRPDRRAGIQLVGLSSHRRGCLRGRGSPALSVARCAGRQGFPAAR